MEKDYSQLEIDNIIIEINLIHYGKLKPEEINFMDQIYFSDKISQEQRDILIKIYDAVGEAGY